MTTSDVEVLESDDQVIVAAEREGVKAAVLVDGESRVDGRDTRAMFAEIGHELGQYAFAGASMLHKRDDDVVDEPTVVTDGGTSRDDIVDQLFDISEDLERLEEQLESFDDDPELVLGSICGDMSIICIDMAGALSREIGGADEFRIDDDQVLTDGGESLPIGVAAPDEIEVPEWAAPLELGQPVAFDLDGRSLEAEVLGFSDWDEYQGLPVVRPPEELEFDEHVDLLVLREEDLVGVDDGEEDPEVVADGGVSVVDVELDPSDAEKVDRAAQLLDDVTDRPSFIREATLRFVDELLDEDGRLECPHDDCNQTFATIAQRRGHIGNAHVQEFPDGDFWCGYCGYGPTTWRGVNAHHGQSSHDGPPVRLDEEPPTEDLIAPGDVPDHQDPRLLEQLYREHDGSITELCRAHDFDVQQGRVRHYLIEFGIHEPTPHGSSEDGPTYRNREFLEEQYERFGGNISEMHRELDLQVSYRGLQNLLKRWGIHDPTDPPGKRHGKSGPDPERRGDGIETECPGCGNAWEYTGAKDSGETTACGTCQRGNVEIGNTEDGHDESDASADDESFEELNAGDEESRPAHKDPELLRAAFERHDTIADAAEEFPDADYNAVRYQMVQHGVYEPDSYGTASKTGTSETKEGDGSDSGPTGNQDQKRVADDESTPLRELDLDNAHDLRHAYEATDSIAEAADLFPDATYGVVRQYLIDHGIHEPEDRSTEEQEPELESVLDDEDDVDEPDPSVRQLDIDFEFEDEFQSVGKHKEVNSDRVIGDEPFCPKCGEVYQGEGTCESCSNRLEDDLVADGGLTLPESCPNCGAEDPDLVSTSPLGGPDRDLRLDCCDLAWPPDEEPDILGSDQGAGGGASTGENYRGPVTDGGWPSQRVDLSEAVSELPDARIELEALAGEDHRLRSHDGVFTFHPHRTDDSADLVTDGGTSGPLFEAHEAALEDFFNGEFEHLPEEVREELEAAGLDPEDLNPALGGVRGGLWREDLPRAVATILERVDGRVEITAHPSDEIGHHYEVEWNRLDVERTPEPDGGFETAAEFASRQEQNTSSPQLEKRLDQVLGWSTVAAIALHGPIDLGVTAYAWHLEANPLVLELGLGPWLGVKAVLIAAAALLYIDTRREESNVYQPLALLWIGFLLMMGLLLILPNVIPLMGVFG